MRQSFGAQDRVCGDAWKVGQACPPTRKRPTDANVERCGRGKRQFKLGASCEAPTLSFYKFGRVPSSQIPKNGAIQRRMRCLVAWATVAAINNRTSRVRMVTGSEAPSSSDGNISQLTATAPGNASSTRSPINLKFMLLKNTTLFSQCQELCSFDD